MILTKQVSDAHLAGLRRDGVSYIFAGERKLDLALALEILNRELGIERLLLEGGGKSNGSFLLAGLIDEISLAVCPAVDGARGGPYAFDSHDDETDARAPLRSMTLESCGLTIDNLFVGLRPEAPNGGGPSAPFRIPVGVGGKETAPPDLQPDSFGCVPLRFVFGGLLRF